MSEQYIFKQEILIEMEKSRDYIDSFLRILLTTNQISQWKISKYLLNWQKSLFDILSTDDDIYEAFVENSDVALGRLQAKYTETIETFSKFPYYDPLINDEYSKCMLFTSTLKRNKNIVVFLNKPNKGLQLEYVHLNIINNNDENIHWKCTELIFFLNWETVPNIQFEEISIAYLNASNEQDTGNVKKLIWDHFPINSYVYQQE